MSTYVRSVGRKRDLKKLSETDTERAVEFIKRKALEQRHPNKFVAHTLGCSSETARRILNSSRPYKARLNRAYAVAFASRTGYPLELVVDFADTDYAAALSGWTSISEANVACKTAAMLAAGVASRAMVRFGMVAHYTVTHGHDGRPKTAEISIPSKSGCQRITFAESAAGGLQLTFRDWKNEEQAKGVASDKRIDTILQHIKNETTYISSHLAGGHKARTTNTRRRYTRSTTGASRGSKP